MPRVSHHFVVDRPIGLVFDVVTTARFWPEWHPATQGVEGDIDHPAGLGDRIIEHVTIAGITGTGTWTVVEHNPPHSLALESVLGDNRLRISYRLDAVGDGFVTVVDEWESVEHFQQFFADPDLQALIGAMGANPGPPDITIAEAVTSPDEF